MRETAQDGTPVGISYSMGTSSEWLIQAMIEGVIPRPRHVAVFNADTKDEHVWSYERAERVKERCAAAGIPFFQGSPFKTPDRWRQTSEEDLPMVFDTDERIRHGLENVGVIETVYLTDRLIPVEQLIRRGDPQPSLPGFDAPGCDGGACFL